MVKKLFWRVIFVNIKFGTGGWRVSKEDFNEENITKVIVGIAKYLKEEYFSAIEMPLVVVGFDCRAQSRGTASYILSVLRDALGFDVEGFKSPITTPMLMDYVANTLDCVGIMVTASHNSFDVNGIKFISEGGLDATKDITDKIEWYSNNCRECPPLKISSTEWLTNDYVTGIITQLKNISKIKKRNFNIVVDIMHGSSAEAFKKLAEGLNISYKLLNEKPLGFCNYEPRPCKENNKELIDEVVRGGGLIDLGIAFDGDGDRLGIVDRFGNYIDGNDLVCLMANYLYKSGMKCTISKSCCTTNRLRKIAQKYGYDCIDTCVGIKYLVNNMKSLSQLFAGEQNGGMIFAEHLYGKDAIYTLAKVLEMLAIENKSVSELISDMYREFCWVSPTAKTILWHYNNEDVAKIKDTIFGFVPVIYGYVIRDISKMDGIKITYSDDSFISCRFSGTEPVIRIIVDADKEEKADSILSIYSNNLKEILGDLVWEE